MPSPWPAPAACSKSPGWRCGASTSGRSWTAVRGLAQRRRRPTSPARLLQRSTRSATSLIAIPSYWRGFFTLVAAPCVLGNQCVLLLGVSAAGLALWIVGVAFWLALTYAMIPGLMEGAAKPKPEEGLN